MTSLLPPNHSYSPQANGARCELCILAVDGRPDRPVPPETHRGDVIALVGEAPGATEVDEGRPFVGASGRLQMEILEKVRVPRSKCHITNALLCRPPDNDLKRLEVTLNARNKNRKKRGEQPRPHPIDCCRPRLVAEIAHLDNIITLGGAGLRALSGKRQSVLAARGGPMTLREISPNTWVTEPQSREKARQYQNLPSKKLLPTLHPALVLREPKWRAAFEIDHARAIRYFTDSLTWKNPEMVFQPSITELATFLGVVRDPTAVGRGPGWADGWRAHPGPPQAFDFETDSIDPMTAKTRCIQIGTAKKVLVPFFLTCEHPRVRLRAGLPARSDFSLRMRRAPMRGNFNTKAIAPLNDPRVPAERFWCPEDEHVLKCVISAWATGPRLKVGWNSNSYDAIVFEQDWWFNSTPVPHLDGIAVHHLVEPELPHSLAYVGSILTDAPRWKQDHAATTAQSDEELGVYGAVDTGVTATVCPPILTALTRHNMGSVRPDGQVTGTLRLVQELQRVGRSMKRVGMLVDQVERDRLFTKYHDISTRYAARCRAIADDPSLNLNSRDQVAALIYGRNGFNLEAVEFTDSGSPSVGDSSIRSLLADPFLPETTREWLKMYRQFKKADKVKGTFLRPAGPVLRGTPREDAAAEAHEAATKTLQELRAAFPLPNADSFYSGEKLDTADKNALKTILHDLWKLPPVLTKSRGVSVSKNALVEHWRRKDAPPAARAFLTAWFKHQLASSEAKRLAKPPEDKEENRCLIGPSGRVHCGWNMTRVVTGRAASQPNCYDDQTEILTTRGWVPFPQLDPFEEVAQWTPTEDQAGTIEFVNATSYFAGPHDGPMIRYQTRSIDLLVTPDHRCPFYTRRGVFEVREAKDIIPDRKQPHSGLYAGGSITPSAAFIAFLCAVQADAHWHDGAWSFAFAKTRKQERLMWAIEALGDQLELVSVGQRQPKNGKPQKRYRVKGPLAHHLRELLGSPREFGPWLLTWTGEALAAFADEVMLWDDCATRMNHYSSNQKTNADWVQIAYTLTGRRSRLRSYDNGNPNSALNWQADVAQNGYTWSSNAVVEEVPYSGKVYCVEVPSGFLVVRRGNCAVISGNTQNWPRKIRSMIVPGAGRDLVYADMDQLELRVAAARWGIPRYLEAFDTTKTDSKGKVYNMDPHQISMHAVFGDVIWTWEGAPPKGWYFYKKWPGGKIHGYFDEQRDLTKRVVYSCGASGTPVSVIDSRGYVEIQDLKPGDYTTAWSRTKKQYEPAKITNVWSPGTRHCVQITFRENGQKGTQAVTFTDEHLFLLRDGTYRPAAQLQPGDRLMPYRRSETAQGYRTVDARNDGSRQGEHRMVMGALDAGRTTHVHHKDEDKRNNTPENLEVLTASAHYEEHREALRAGVARYNAEAWSPENREATNRYLTEGRVNSPVWQAAIRKVHQDPERGRKIWETRRANGTDKLGPQPSVIDPFESIIGTVPDREVAELAGVTPEAVWHWRKIRGIPSWEAMDRAANGTARARILALRDRLGVDTDAAVATAASCDRALVGRVRQELGIPARGKKGLKRGLRPSKLDDYKGLFGYLRGGDIAALAGATAGTVSHYAKSRELPSRRDAQLGDYFDTEIGHTDDITLGIELGVAFEILAAYRLLRGIPAYWEMEGEPHNHIVVSVEDAGLHEVWDIEVDHEDHNFALEAGIFVHNSIYAAEPPTVHDVITSAEDRNGRLVYQDLTIRQVTVMQEAWKAGVPEVPKGWDFEQRLVETEGFFEDPITGRRMFHLNGMELNKIVNGPIQCFTERMRILTTEGYKPITALKQLPVFRTWTGKRWAPAKVIPRGTGLIYRLRTKRGLRYELTADHEVLRQDPDAYRWCAVRDLQRGDLFAVDLARPVQFTDAPEGISAADARVLGYWYGNGHAYTRDRADGDKRWTEYQIGFCVGNVRPDAPDRAGLPCVARIEAWAARHGLKANVLERTVGTGALTWTVTVYGKATWQHMRDRGVDPTQNAHTKRIPAQIYCASLEARCAFLRGFLDADGYRAPDGHVAVNLCQRDLLQDLWLLARTVGIDGQHIKGPYKADEKGHTSWRLRLSAAQTNAILGWPTLVERRMLRGNQFSVAPGFEAKRVLDRLKPGTQSDRVLRSRIRKQAEPRVSAYILQRMGVDDVYDHDAVEAVECTGREEPVYTLTVDHEERRYVGEGLVSKNCMGASLVALATIRFDRLYPENFGGPNTGLLNLCHDALTAESPKDRSEQMRADMQECMTLTHPSLPGVDFIAEAIVKQQWEDPED